MKIAIDEMIINEIIKLLEELASEKDYKLTGGDPNSKITTQSAIRMRKITRMLKTQMSTDNPVNGGENMGEKHDISDNPIVERQIKDEIQKNAEVLLASIQKACDSGLFERKDHKWIRKFLINFDFKVCDIIASTTST